MDRMVARVALSKALPDLYLDVVGDKGGFTWPEPAVIPCRRGSGDRVPGYMVSLPVVSPGDALRVSRDSLTVGVLQDWAESNLDAVQAGLYLGGWADPKGIIHLEISMRVPTLVGALYLGKRWCQDYIYDLETKACYATR